MDRLEPTAEQQWVLAKAIINVVTQLNLFPTQLSDILDLDTATITQPDALLPELNPQPEAGQRAILLVDIFKRFYVMASGDLAQMQYFMHAQNLVSNGIPVEQMSCLDGMKNILAVLEMQ